MKITSSFKHSLRCHFCGSLYNRSAISCIVIMLYTQDYRVLSIKQIILSVAVLDIQNFFHKVLAVIFTKVQHLYFRRKLSASSIEWYHFPVVHSMYAEITFTLIFPIQTSLNEKCKHASLVQYRFLRYKYLCEDHSMAQTVVSLSSSYTKLFWRTSCFFQKGQASRIAIIRVFTHIN